ncbi:MAG: hypothetical protein C4558_07585 [Dehalococcoidia bacterium]|nr:MAG: hypothetical protein C4558_07585 [Dehalococcoidia bacterium]
MTSSHDEDPGPGAVLRAVASLLMALGHQGGVGMSHGVAEPQRRPPPPTREPLPESQPQSDFASVIEEARERAQRVLDEGVARAHALSRPVGVPTPASGTPSGDPEAARQFDELRRSIALMSDDVRDVQQRLARIEMMLRDAPRSAASSVPPPISSRVSIAPPGTPSAAPPLYASPVYAPPAPPPAPPRRAEQPEGLPPSAVPPMRVPQTPPIPPPLPASPAPPPPPPVVIAPRPPAVAPPPPPPSLPATPGAVEPAPEPPVVETAPTALPTRPAATPSSGEAPIVTFVPEDGSVLVRVAPVAGFQGLMRVQDALARLRGIRQTAVEAYSQGEARLRLELTEVTGSDEIADGLAGTLSMPVQVRDASEAERSMLIVLG